MKTDKVILILYLHRSIVKCNYHYYEHTKKNILIEQSELTTIFQCLLTFTNPMTRSNASKQICKKICVKYGMSYFKQ